MMQRLALLLLVLLFNVCRAEEVAQFPIDPPNPADFARAVNYYVALGEKPAVHALYERARHDGLATSLLCRALFEPKPNQELRAPWWGSLYELPVITMTAARWPFLPLALFGKTYFVLSLRFMLAGAAEDPQDYVSFCHANGVFRREPVPVPTRAQAWHDALALRQSPTWKALKWKDKAESISYTLSEQGTWNYVKAQAAAVQTP